jgi:hypothetical protein
MLKGALYSTGSTTNYEMQIDHALRLHGLKRSSEVDEFPLVKRVDASDFALNSTMSSIYVRRILALFLVICTSITITSRRSRKRLRDSALEYKR